MVDPNDLEEVGEEKSTEAVEAEEANKSVLEQAAEFHERKEEAEEDLKKYKKEKKKTEKKEEKKAAKEADKESSAEEGNVIPTIEGVPEPEQPVEEAPKEETPPEPIEEPKEEVPIEKPAKARPVRDVTKLNVFKDKVVKDFGLTETTDNNGCSVLKFDGFLVCKLLPRTNCFFGVWREDPAEDNKWKAFRVYSEEDEQTTYDHIKEFVKVNTEN